MYVLFPYPPLCELAHPLTCQPFKLPGPPSIPWELTGEERVPKILNKAFSLSIFPVASMRQSFITFIL